MAIKLPDWLRAFAVLGKFGDDYKVLATDVAGQLYMLLVGGTITSITDDVNVTQDDSTRDVQGTDGANLRTLSVDANGQLIMVPRGESGEYMDVDANGFLSSVMKGLDGAALRTLAVDADGNLISVMKGQGTAGLETVKLDDDGRMYAYISDENDQWGNPIPTGLTELAARLGSPIAYERRGQVIFTETFDQGVDDYIWTAETASSTIKLSAASKVHGGYSALMHRTKNTGGWNKLGRRFALGASTTIGFSTWFRMLGTPHRIRFNILVDNGSDTYKGGLMIDIDVGVIYYKDSAGADQGITVFPCFPTTEKHFHFIKFTLDFAARTYGYAIINGAEVDLSAHSLETGISAIRQVLPTVEIYAEVGNDADVYVDSLVLTTMDS